MAIFFALMKVFGFRRTAFGVLALLALRTLLRRRRRQAQYAWFASGAEPVFSRPLRRSTQQRFYQQRTKNLMNMKRAAKAALSRAPRATSTAASGPLPIGAETRHRGERRPV